MLNVLIFWCFVTNKNDSGERRYIIAHPSQCKDMALYPKSHPSQRHSSIDWSNPLEWDNDPNFRHAQVTEVVMHAGDVL